jgi:predicted RND superfamily exporter protein
MTFDELALGEAAASMSDSTADSEGYLIGDQGRIKILFVQQSKNIDNTEYIVPFMRYCRDTAAQVMQKHPGVTVGFTGWPVAIEEEIGLIRRDLNRVSWIATAVIFLLVWFAFRSIHRTLLMFIPVAVSIVWNFGITLFTIGHLNYLTSAFVGILFGLGIDYGVVFIRRFDEEIGAGRTPAEAITNTLMNVGQSVANGAATTIAAFFAIGFTDQPAFNELGIVAGTGIICAILATFFVMPALMYRFPPKQKPGETDRLTESKLLRAAAQKMLPGAKWVALGLLALLVLAAAQIPRLRFDYNLNNLLPADSETVRVTARLESATKYKAQYVSVVADNLEQTRRLHELLEKLPSVARVESMALLIPSEQAEKQRLFPDIEAALNGVTIKTKAGPPDIKALRARLTTLNQRLQAAQEDAFAAGLKDLVAHLDNFLVRLETINQLLDRPEAAARQAAFETAFFGELAKAKTEFLRMLNADPITLDNLDPAMKERFQGRSGRLATMVFPKEQIWDVKFLDEFVGEIEKAAAGVLGPDKLVERITGFGVVYRTTTRMIHHGFQQASIVAAIAVFLLVLIDFRKLRAVFLTLVPLGSAILLSLGVLAVTGRQLNMANQLYLPILLGIGIDYGILMTHRWLEPDGVDLPRVVATMGNALWLAAGTAMTGFGALLFAHHQGMMSFGGTLTMAVAITMLVAIFGHPMVIKALGLDPRNKSARARK